MDFNTLIRYFNNNEPRECPCQSGCMISQLILPLVPLCAKGDPGGERHGVGRENRSLAAPDLRYFPDLRLPLGRRLAQETASFGRLHGHPVGFFPRTGAGPCGFAHLGGSQQEIHGGNGFLYALHRGMPLRFGGDPGALRTENQIGFAGASFGTAENFGRLS